jgi:hypothetical protein
MEEGFVLDIGQAWVVQEVRVHESSRLMVYLHLLAFGFLRLLILYRFVAPFIFRQLLMVFLCFFFPSPRDGVLASLLFEFSLHQNVEEVDNSRSISQLS